MEEVKVPKSHRVLIGNRKTGSFTGVLDVLSFDLAEILLETEQGMLIVKGKDLHVNRLNLEKGEVDMEGLISSLEYSQIPKKAQKHDSIWDKLLR